MISLYNFWQARPCYYHASIILTLGLNFEIISSNICRWHLMWIYQYPSPIIATLKSKNKCSTTCYSHLRNLYLLFFFFKGPPLFCRDHIRGTGLGPLGGAFKAVISLLWKPVLMGGRAFLCRRLFIWDPTAFSV